MRVLPLARTSSGALVIRLRETLDRMMCWSCVAEIKKARSRRAGRGAI
jgi:hypothetical protein